MPGLCIIFTFQRLRPTHLLPLPSGLTPPLVSPDPRLALEQPRLLFHSFPPISNTTRHLTAPICILSIPLALHLLASTLVFGLCYQSCRLSRKTDFFLTFASTLPVFLVHDSSRRLPSLLLDCLPLDFVYNCTYTCTLITSPPLCHRLAALDSSFSCFLCYGMPLVRLRPHRTASNPTTIPRVTPALQFTLIQHDLPY